MAWWGWLLVGIGIGAAGTSLAVLAWVSRFQRAWDRAWGWR
jgi:hypothetical protein